MASAADALSSRSYVNLRSRDLKACMAFGTCALRPLSLSDTAILQFASVVESNFLLAARGHCSCCYLVASLDIPHGIAARKKRLS